MRQGPLLAAIAIAAAAAGTGLWWAMRPAAETAAPSIAVSPGVLFATAFSDPEGARHSLAEFGGKVIVLNFWATWCAPCREEMPAFARLQARWADRGVQFVGLADDDPAKVSRFGRDLAINYPLWVGEEAGELSRRLGNRQGVLPHTVLLDRNGRVLDSQVGTYSEADLEAKLRQITGNV